MVWRKAIVILVALALVLPIALVVILGTSYLLAAMQDGAGAAVLGRIGLALGIGWVVDLIALVIVQSLAGLGPPPDGPQIGGPLE